MLGRRPLWGLVGVAVALSLMVDRCSCAKGDITPADLLRIFNEATFETARDPRTFQGRDAMQRYLKGRLSSTVAYASSSSPTTNQQVGVVTQKNQLFEQTFHTKFLVSEHSPEEKSVIATNYIVVFEGNNHKSEDEPLLLLANYDTEEKVTNPVDDNGSGLVTLVAVADYMAHQISSGKLALNKTLILAATDMALYKYDIGPPNNATSGAEELVRGWLHGFMEDRRKFTGALVLDSLMNYNPQPRTQVDTQFSKSFPLAYRDMSERSFKGDFLAVVQREELDQPLARAFSRAWTQSSGDFGGALIPFTFTNSTFTTSSPPAIHFLRSEQGAFWNHLSPHMRRLPKEHKQLPALLLTDTERYRSSPCDQSFCTVKKMATEKNLEFLAKTANALVATIKNLQMDHPEDEHNNGVGLRLGLLGLLGSLLPLITALLLSL